MDNGNFERLSNSILSGREKDIPSIFLLMFLDNFDCKLEFMMHRRDFLQASTVMITPLSLKLSDTADQLNENVALAVATICLDGFGNEKFDPAFEIIPQTGISNVEFNVWYGGNITPRGIESIRLRCYQHGLTPISLQGSSFGGNVTKDVGHKLWLMQQAKNLGARRVKFTGSKRGEAGGLENVIIVLRELAPAAEEMDVIIAVENHANNNIENMDDYDRIFSAVDSSHVGMCLDMGHFDGASVDNLEVIDRFHDKINHVDIKDVVAVGTYKSVPYGTGVTKGELIVETLLQKGYTGYLVIEQAPPKEGLDVTSEMIRIRKIFKKYETT